MTDFTRIFGGSAISAALSDYSSISFSSNITLQWPIEAVPATALLLISSKIIDATATAASLSMKLPEANKVSKGYTIFINNVGANSFVVKNNAGTDIVTITPGNSYLLYLTGNSDAAGVWRTIQAGAVSSAAVASALAGAGLKATGSLLAVAFLTTNKSISYTVGESDRAKTLRWTGGTGTFTLPDPTTMAADFFFFFRNDGSGTLSLTPAAGTINGVASVSVSPGGSGVVFGNGSLYYSVGIGALSVVGFDYTSIAVPGTGNYILSGAELNRIAYKFTGILTGARTIEVPNTVQQYWVDNATTGAFTLSVKTAAGASVTVTQGQRALLYCNGTDVIDADTQGISSPVAIADGGTGATTASAARTNLGATSVGDAIFIAVSAAAARAALGATATGDALFTAASAAAGRATLDAAGLSVPNIFTAIPTVRPDNDANREVSFAVEGGIGLVQNMHSLGAGGSVFEDWRVNGGDADFDYRALRATGANGAMQWTNKGTGGFQFITGGIQVGSPTGGNPGSGGVNAAVSVKERGRGLGKLDVVIVSGATDAPGVDDIATIRVYTNAAGCAVTLPATATVGDGYRFQGVNASAGNVTYTRSGTDDIDGGGTVITQQNGAGYNRLDFYVANGDWFTGTRRFKSANQTITAAGALTLAHGLAAQPDRIYCILTCISAEENYSIGDEINIGAIPADFGSAGGYGVSAVPDGTNLNIRYGSSAGSFVVTNKTTGALATITAANFRAIFMAEY